MPVVSNAWTFVSRATNWTRESDRTDDSLLTGIVAA